MGTDAGEPCNVSLCEGCYRFMRSLKVGGQNQINSATITGRTGTVALGSNDDNNCGKRNDTLDARGQTRTGRETATNGTQHQASTAPVTATNSILCAANAEHLQCSTLEPIHRK